jgi:hypothetical protein
MRAEPGKGAASPPPITFAESLLVAAVALLFVVARAPLFTAGALARGWSSDTAILGLMGSRMLDAGRFDVYFWDQDYLGPLLSIVAALLGALFRATGLAPGVGPLALRSASVLLSLVVVLLAWQLGRRLAGPAPALAAAAWLALGPPAFFRNSVLSCGAEMALLFELGLLAWLDGELGRDRPLSCWPKGRILFFGLVAGFAVWMNESLLLALPGLVLLLAGRSEPGGRFLRALRLRDRLLFDPAPLGWRPLSAFERGTLLFLEGGVVAGGAAGISASLGLVPSLVPFGALLPFSPTPAAILLLATVHVASELAFRRPTGHSTSTRPDDRRSPSLRLRAGLLPFLPLALGLLAGALPPLLGRLLGWSSGRFGYTARWLDPAELPGRAGRFLRRDLWEGIGGAPGTAAFPFAVAVILLAGVRFLRDLPALGEVLGGRSGASAGRFLAWALVAADFVFYLGNERVELGGPRYLLPAAPLLFLFAAQQLFDFVSAVFRRLPIRSPETEEAASRGGGAPAFVLLVLCGLAALLPGVRRETARILAGPDPRPLLAAIRGEGYRVCFAEYYQAFALELVSNGEVRFVPNNGPRRNVAESLRLVALPGPQCVVDPLLRFRPAGSDPRDRLVELPADPLAERRSRSGTGELQPRLPPSATSAASTSPPRASPAPSSKGRLR